VLHAAKDLAEVVGVGEAAGVGDLLERRARVEQHAGRPLDTNLGRESGGGEPGARAEEMAEMGAAHAVVGGQRIHVEGLGQTRDDARSKFFQQPLAFDGVVARLLCALFARHQEFEEGHLDLEAIPKILLDGSAHEP